MKKFLKFETIVILLSIIMLIISICLGLMCSKKDVLGEQDYSHQQEYFKNLDTCKEVKLDFYDWEQE